MPESQAVRVSTPITVCTVSYHHAEHLRLNIELAAKLNAGADIRWLIGENTPVGSPLRLENSPELPNVEVVATEGLVPERKNKRPQDYHTGALMHLIERVQTRYMLILDPDFYIVAPNWLQDVTSHMQAKGLALLGAPWHPRHVRKYRYFPAVHCTFVDHETFRDRPYTVKNIHDFRKGLALKARFVAPGVKASGLQRRWRAGVLSRLFAPRWKRSWAIRDTGSELFSRYWSGEAIPNECLIPVYDAASELGPVRMMLDKVLPEDLSYTPKRSGSYTREDDFLPKTEDTTDWEAFLWRGKPFGFHMRGNSNRQQRDAQAEVEMVRQLTDSLTQVPGQ